jgi:N-acetyl-anhydromuramyl-L-alanine amidase AmpD
MPEILKFKWIPAQADSFTKGRTGAIKSIILHSSEGHKAGDIATLTGKSAQASGAKVSCHWYITTQGEIYHFVANDDTAWHVGHVKYPKLYGNNASIGIEQEHFSGKDTWTKEQVMACANLVAAIEQHEHKKSLLVRGHFAVCTPPGRKTDPADYPWGHFNQYLSIARGKSWTLVKDS